MRWVAHLLGIGALTLAVVAFAEHAAEDPSLRVSEHSIRVDGDLAEWTAAGFRTITVGGRAVADVALVYDREHLYLAYRVQDSSPLLNRGQDPLNHYHEGDAVELLLGPWRDQPAAPQAGDLRLLLVPLVDGAKAVLYRQVDPTSTPDDHITFQSPVRQVTMQSVRELADARVAFQATPDGYICEAAVPLRTLGVTPRSGLRLRGDMGVLQSNAGGMFTQARSCLFDALATCVSDLPTEVELTPARWGAIAFVAKTAPPAEAPARCCGVLTKEPR